MWPSGTNLETKYDVDPLGRTIKETDPDGVITYIVYNDANHEIRTYSGWVPTQGIVPAHATGPVQVSRTDQAYGYDETLTYAPTAGPMNGRV
jgi:YD repeat-containing protein